MCYGVVVYECIRCRNRFIARFSSSEHSVNSSVCYCVCHNSFDNKLNFTRAVFHRNSYRTAVANMAFMVLSVPLIRPRIMLQLQL